MKALGDFFRLYGVILAIYLTVYFVFAGTVYWVFYILKKDAMQIRKIQIRIPVRKIIFHEIRWSVVTMIILSFIGTITFTGVFKGYSKIYYSVSEFGWLYLIGSVILCIFLNDTYFYWVHRFMHLKVIFPRVHRIHHLSNA